MVCYNPGKFRKGLILWLLVLFECGLLGPVAVALFFSSYKIASLMWFFTFYGLAVMKSDRESIIDCNLEKYVSINAKYFPCILRVAAFICNSMFVILQIAPKWRQQQLRKFITAEDLYWYFGNLHSLSVFCGTSSASSCNTWPHTMLWQLGGYKVYQMDAPGIKVIIYLNLQGLFHIYSQRTWLYSCDLSSQEHYYVGRGLYESTQDYVK